MDGDLQPAQASIPLRQSPCKPAQGAQQQVGTLFAESLSIVEY
jgi:hypothetical protein